MLRYVALTAALLFVLAPVYWMLTISLKTEVEQFAIPPPWFVFTPTVNHYYDAFVTREFRRIIAHQRDRGGYFNSVRTRHRYTRSLCTRAVSASLESQSPALFVDSFDTYVSGNRHGGAAFSNDARRATA